MVMETLLPFSQNALEFLIKSRRQAFLYPACAKSHGANYSAGPSARVYQHSMREHAFKGGENLHFYLG